MLKCRSTPALDAIAVKKFLLSLKNLFLLTSNDLHQQEGVLNSIVIEHIGLGWFTACFELPKFSGVNHSYVSLLYIYISAMPINFPLYLGRLSSLNSVQG